MRYHNELRSVGVTLDVLCKSFDVDLVQCRLDLVENTEGRGVDLKRCKEERDSDKRLLASAELHQILDYLSGRCSLYLNSAFKHVFGVCEIYLGRAAAEKF